MLKRKYRLPSSVRLTNAKTISVPLFLLRISGNTLSYSRFGFIISKKTAKTSVDRNRSKRLLRSCVEEIQGQIKQGRDHLFVIKNNIADIKRDIVLEQVRKTVL